MDSGLREAEFLCLEIQGQSGGTTRRHRRTDEKKRQRRKQVNHMEGSIAGDTAGGTLLEGDTVPKEVPLAGLWPVDKPHRSRDTPTESQNHRITE